MRRLRHLIALMVGLVAIMALAGCDVTGTIKVDGQIPVGAKLLLCPVTPQGPDAVLPTANVKPDGSFVVTTYKSGDGAPPGEYVVTVAWYKIDKDGAVGPNVIPEQYANPKTSPIKVTITSPGPTTIEPTAMPFPALARRGQ